MNCIDNEQDDDANNFLSLNGLWSSSTPSLVVWDFDLTITRLHTWHAGWLSKEAVNELSAEYIRQDVFADFEFFKETVEMLKQKGVHIGIATFQYTDVVKALLDKAYGGAEHNPFAIGDIIGRLYIFRNKLKMIMHLAERNNISLVDSVVWFFDDDSKNLKKIDQYTKRESKKIKTFHVDKQIHFCRDVYSSSFKEIK